MSKHYVINWNDVDKYLSEGEKMDLGYILASIETRREEAGQTPTDGAVIFGADHPYIDQARRLYAETDYAQMKEGIA